MNKDKLIDSLTVEDLIKMQNTAASHDPVFIDQLMSQVIELKVRLNDQNNLIATLTHEAMSDHLTGLVNRRVFETELKRSVSIARRYKRRSALLMIDVDNFKSINDNLGHLVGDMVLKHLANLLLQNTRPNDVVARVGGDEFSIILNELESNQSAQERAQMLEDIIAKTPCMVDGRQIAVAVSIGAYTFATNAEISDILHQADLSMYSRKGDKNSSVVTND